MSKTGDNKLLVIFDIDETLFHFINGKARKGIWDILTEKQKSKFQTYFPSTGDHVVLIRPYLDKLFGYLKAQFPVIRVGLFTWSERDYAAVIADILKELYGLPDNFFLFKYGSEDCEEILECEKGLGSKDLTYVYEKHPKFNVFNTILVDDLPSNVYHQNNSKQSVLIQPYNPFGTWELGKHSSKRRPMTKFSYRLAKKDNILDELLTIIQTVLKDIKGCDEDDFKSAFKREPVFSEKRVKRMKLGRFYKTYVQKWVNLMTIGMPVQSDNAEDKPFRQVKEFDIIPSTIAATSSPVEASPGSSSDEGEGPNNKGGRRRTRRHRRSRSRSHKRTHSRRRR